MAEVFKENQENRERKQKDLEAQVASDVATMRAYNILLDQQDKQRQAEKEARLERQKALMDRMKQTVLAQVRLLWIG